VVLTGDLSASSDGRSLAPNCSVDLGDREPGGTLGAVGSGIVGFETFSESIRTFLLILRSGESGGTLGTLK